MTWRAPLSVTCLFCHEAKEEPKRACMFWKGRYCILCYVQEGVSICRKCLVPWQDAYDGNNAFSEELKYARAEAALPVSRVRPQLHMLCLECVREDKANLKRLTLPVWALDVKARLQLQKIRKVVAKFGPPPLFELIAMRMLNLKPPPLNDQGAADRQPGCRSRPGPAVQKVLTSRKVQNQKLVLKKVASMTEEGAEPKVGHEADGLCPSDGTSLFAALNLECHGMKPNEKFRLLENLGHHDVRRQILRRQKAKTVQMPTEVGRLPRFRAIDEAESQSPPQSPPQFPEAQSHSEADGLCHGALTLPEAQSQQSGASQWLNAPSKAHPDNCQPCWFTAKNKGCDRDGCLFCHQPHDTGDVRLSRPKRENSASTRQRQAKRQAQIDFLNAHIRVKGTSQ